jgi:peptidase M23-like protein
MADYAAAPSAVADTRARAAISVSTANLVLAIGAVLAFGVTYMFSFWLYVLPTVPLVLAVVTVASRGWHARQGRVELGLLRHPFRRELRPYLLQAVNQVLLWCLVALTVGPTLGALDVFVSDSLARALAIGTWIALAALVLAALVPRRRIYIPTNIAVACAVLFFGLQVVRLALPPNDPVTIDMPYAGQWWAFSAGRSPLVNDHWGTQTQRHALDMIQVVDGKSYRGDKQKLTSYYAFGKTLVAPTAGRVTAVVESRPDLPIGDSDLSHPEGNVLVLDIGGGRYVMMAHIQHGSIAVAVGDDVRRGQPIAKVGNSGNTSEPHLHIQVQNKPEFGNEIVGLHTYPILFRNTVLIRDGKARPPGDADARRNDFLRAG